MGPPPPERPTSTGWPPPETPPHSTATETFHILFILHIHITFFFHSSRGKRMIISKRKKKSVGHRSISQQRIDASPLMQMPKTVLAHPINLATRKPQFQLI